MQCTNKRVGKDNKPVVIRFGRNSQSLFPTKPALQDNPYSMVNFMSSQGNQTHAEPFYGQKAKLVVAIDFGTTYSGYAIVHIGDSSNIVECKYLWPDQPARYPKNITALIYKCD
ncbi:hypothetical protein BC938DRAFT_470859, partial [Jimgerdemannia flammicorona]